MTHTKTINVARGCNVGKAIQNFTQPIKAIILSFNVRRDTDKKRVRATIKYKLNPKL
jgi:hypothetical protein